MSAAWAGPGTDPTFTWWRVEPLSVLPLALLVVALTAGRRRGGSRRRSLDLALVALGVGLLPPVASLSDVLLTAHVVQHLLITQVAAPLFVSGRPEGALPHALPRAWRRRLARRWRATSPERRALAFLSTPGAAFTAHLVATWSWHAPPAYEASLRSPLLHAIEHVTLFGAAVLFWRAALHPRGRARTGHGGAILLVFVTALHSGVLAVLLGASAEAWYPSYSRTTEAFGLTAAEDQQLGGALLWVGGGALYAVAALWLVADWFRSAARRHTAGLGR